MIKNILIVISVLLIFFGMAYWRVMFLFYPPANPVTWQDMAEPFYVEVACVVAALAIMLAIRTNEKEEKNNSG